MVSQIPARRSWWYYAWRWIAITAAFFIWVVIDWFDVLSRLFPTWTEPAWMRATTEVGVVPMLGLIVSMTIATAVVIWIVRRENDVLRQVATRADQSGLSITQQFRQIYDQMISLKDCWEDDYPAGPEAWRTEFDALTKRAEMLLREHYSPEEANQFKHLTWKDWKDQPGIDYGDSEESQRSALLLVRGKFLYLYATE